jgi:hypothetical protein
MNVMHAVKASHKASALDTHHVGTIQVRVEVQLSILRGNGRTRPSQQRSSARRESRCNERDTGVLIKLASGLAKAYSLGCLVGLSLTLPMQ